MNKVPGKRSTSLVPSCCELLVSKLGNSLEITQLTLIASQLDLLLFRWNKCLTTCTARVQSEGLKYLFDIFPAKTEPLLLIFFCVQLIKL